MAGSRGPPVTGAVRAALFDLDGTLVDSEVHTDAAIRAIAARHGVADFALPAAETRGRTWAYIADVMRRETGLAAARDALADELLVHWTGIATDVTPVPGAPEALRAAARHLALGVVSSSPRAVIDDFLRRLGVADLVPERARIGGDAVRASKPDPDGFLQGARALDTAPADCLVFEDSRAGLEAARAAGMRSMFIRCCAADVAANAALATASLQDYRCLPADFWSDLAAGRLELAGRVYA